jgi:2-oxoglutarate dehydrogenase E1 component
VSDAPLAPAQPASEPPAEGRDLPDAEPLRGIAVKIAENMNASLSVPTATSVRSIPVKLLEENRSVINSHQAVVAGPKISFTHLIAWTLLRALERHPRMNSRFAEIDGQPHLVARESINLGLAIDVERKGDRVLLVPTLKDAGSLSFPALVAAYDQLVLRARQNQLTVDDFQDTTVTLTNPGMLGTVMSVPRLMQGQGVIVGVGSIGYPAEYSGMAPEMISELGLSKVMTVTSTYDHRVIQGAESGQFLASMEQLVQGTDRHYERILAEMGVPREPFAWSGDRNPQLLGGGQNVEAIAKQAGGSS